MSNGRACCVLGLCCLVGSAEQRTSLAHMIQDHCQKHHGKKLSEEQAFTAADEVLSAHGQFADVAAVLERHAAAV